MVRHDYVRLTNAAREFGVSRNKLRLLVRGGRLTTYEDPKDGRVTLLDRNELEELFRVRPARSQGRESET